MRFKASDYRISKQPFRPIERLGSSLEQPLENMDSLDEASMVHIAIGQSHGGAAGKGGKGGAENKYTAPPMYPPMQEAPPARMSAASLYQYPQVCVHHTVDCQLNVAVL